MCVCVCEAFVSVYQAFNQTCMTVNMHPHPCVRVQVAQTAWVCTCCTSVLSVQLWLCFCGCAAPP